MPPLPRGRRRSSRLSAVLNRRLPLLSGRSLHPATSIHQRGPHYGASTEVYAIHPSGFPLACDPRMERASLGFPPSFEPRRPGAGRRTSGWGQAMSTGLELRTRHQSNLLSTCSLVSVRPRVATALEDKILQRARGRGAERHLRDGLPRFLLRVPAGALSRMTRWMRSRPGSCARR